LINLFNPEALTHRKKGCIHWTGMAKVEKGEVEKVNLPVNWRLVCSFKEIFKLPLFFFSISEGKNQK
jgi:hypothetical protein